MIRIRSLAATCARECVRSASASGRSSGRGGAKATVVAARAFSASAQPPFANGSIGPAVGPEDDLAAFQPGQDQQGNEEKAEDLEDLLRRHTQAREDWTDPPEMSEYERAQLSKSLLRRIRGLAKARKSTKVGIAIKILDEGRRQGITSLVVYGAVLKQLLSTYGEAEAACENLQAILERMKEDGLEPDHRTYNHILDFHASVHAPQKAEEVYEEMISKGLEPDQKTMSHMIVAHSRGSHNAMYRAVEEMNAKGWKGSRAAYLSMIAVMSKRRDYEGVLNTFRRMREETKKPTEAACVGAFRAAESLGQLEPAKQVFEHRMEVGLPPQEYAYVRMMVMCLKDGQPDQSLDYWRRLVCVNGLNGLTISPDTFNLAIKCATRAGNLEEMEAVVAMMESQGVVPTQATNVAALAGFERPRGAGAPCMEDAERAFAVIAKTGPPPGLALRQRQAVGYAHAGMWQKALDLFGSVLAETTQLSPRDWKCLMMSQFELGKYAELKATWVLSTEERNTSHSYKAIEYALRAADALEDAEWALRLREAASEGGKKSADLDHAVVGVLLKAGRLEEARAVLKEWEALVLTDPNLRVFQPAYELALAICEKKGDAQLALRFFDGMRSASPPYALSSPCPSLEFLRKALKDDGRAGEVQPFFEVEDVRASAESAGGTQAPSLECFEVVAEARPLSHRGVASGEPDPSSTEAGIEAGLGEDDRADPGLSQGTEAGVTEEGQAGEDEAGEASSPKAHELA